LLSTVSFENFGNSLQLQKQSTDGVAILKITDATFAAAIQNSGKKTTISIGMKIACFWFQDASRFGVGYFLLIGLTYLYVPWVGENQ
jgi:hypothetical protein